MAGINDFYNAFSFGGDLYNKQESDALNLSNQRLALENARRASDMEQRLQPSKLSTSLASLNYNKGLAESQLQSIRRLSGIQDSANYAQNQLSISNSRRGLQDNLQLGGLQRDVNQQKLASSLDVLRNEQFVTDNTRAADNSLRFHQSDQTLAEQQDAIKDYRNTRPSLSTQRANSAELKGLQSTDNLANYYNTRESVQGQRVDDAQRNQLATQIELVQAKASYNTLVNSEDLLDRREALRLQDSISVLEDRQRVSNQRAADAQSQRSIGVLQLRMQGLDNNQRVELLNRVIATTKSPEEASAASAMLNQINGINVEAQRTELSRAIASDPLNTASNAGLGVVGKYDNGYYKLANGEDVSELELQYRTANYYGVDSTHYLELLDQQQRGRAKAVTSESDELKAMYFPAGTLTSTLIDARPAQTDSGLTFGSRFGANNEDGRTASNQEIIDLIDSLTVK